MREGLRQDVSPEGSPAVAHWREALRLQLVVLWQKFHSVGRAAETPEDSHWGETLCMPGMWQKVYAKRPSGQAR